MKCLLEGFIGPESDQPKKKGLYIIDKGERSNLEGALLQPHC